MIVLSQGTTPYLSLLIPGYNLSDAGAIMFTVKHKAGTLDIAEDPIDVTADTDGSTLIVHLTQEETLGVAPGIAPFQLRWRDSDGESYITRPQNVNWLEAIYKEVI